MTDPTTVYVLLMGTGAVVNTVCMVVAVLAARSASRSKAIALASCQVSLGLAAKQVNSDIAAHDGFGPRITGIRVHSSPIDPDKIDPLTRFDPYAD